MLGFEVHVNDEVIRSSIDKGLMEVIFTSGGMRNTEQLWIWGSTLSHRLLWYSAGMDCDKITVRIVNIERNSELIEEENRFKNDEDMLRRYYELKQKLESEGLL